MSAGAISGDATWCDVGFRGGVCVLARSTALKDARPRREGVLHALGVWMFGDDIASIMLGASALRGVDAATIVGLVVVAVPHRSDSPVTAISPESPFKMVR